MGQMKSEWHLSIAYEGAESLESVQKKRFKNYFRNYENASEIRWTVPVRKLNQRLTRVY